MSYKKILIAVDSSEYSLLAAKKGMELAIQLNAEVALVYVVDLDKSLGNVEAGIFPEEAKLIIKKEVEETLDSLAKLNSDIIIYKFMPQGDPKKEVVNTAQAWGADLIVVGTHGRTGLLHLLMGSVAESIIHQSKIPVLVVPFGN